MANNASNVLKVAVEATLQNANKVRDELQKALEANLIVFSDKDMQQLKQRIATISQLLNNELYNEAFKNSKSLNNFLLKAFNNINIQAGAASNDLAALEAKLEQLRAEQTKLSRNDKLNPEKRYRYDNRLQGHVLRRSGLDAEELQTIEKARAAYAQTQNDTISSNWNTTGIAYKFRDAIANSNTPEEIKQIFKDALTTLGFEINNGVLKLAASTEQAFNELKANFDKDNAKLNQQIQETEAKVKLEKENLEQPTIISEDGAFTTKALLESTTDAMKQLESAIRAKNAAEEEEAQKERESNDAKEEAIVEQRQLTVATNAGTKAQERQTGAVSRAVTTFFGYQMVLRQLRKLWNEALHTLQELDKQLTDQAIVTNLTREQTWNLVSTYQELGKATGFTTTQIAAVNTEYLRQGNTLKDSLVMTEAAAKAARVAGISATDSVKYLTTALHGFKLEAEDALEVSDKFAALAAESASNYEDLAIALSKVASQAALAGMSMDYTLALLTTGLDVTQEAPESIGTALKTVIARMREISDYGETLTDGTSINQVERALKYVNIELRDSNGELRSSEDVLDELGRKWDTLSANQQAAVAKALAGTRQQSRLVAILDNYQEVLQYQETASMSIGATNAQMQEYLEGMEAAMNKLHVQYEEFIKSITNNDGIIWVVNFLADRLQAITNFLKNPAGMIATISTLLRFAVQSLIPNLVGRLVGVVQNIVHATQEQDRVNKAFEAGRQKVVGTLKTYRELVQEMERANHAAGIKKESTITSADFRAQTQLHAQSTLGSERLMPTADVEQRKIGFNPSTVFNDKSILSGLDKFRTKFLNIFSTAEKRAQRVQGLYNRTNARLVKQYEKRFHKEYGWVNDQIKREQNLRKSQKLTEAERTASEERELLLVSKRTMLTQSGLTLEQRMAILKSNSWTKEMQALAEEQLIKQEGYLKDQQVEVEKQKARREEGVHNKKILAAAEEKLRLAEEEVEKKRKVVALGQQELETQKNGGTGTKLGDVKNAGTKISNFVGKAMGIASIISTAAQWTQEIVDVAMNGMAKKAEAAIEKSQGIQNEIYNNRKLINNFDKLIKSTDQLNNKFLKTADDLEQMKNNREELITMLAGEEGDTLAYERMKDEDLYRAAVQKRTELEKKNMELVDDMNKALFGAANDYNVGEGALNILGKAGTGAMVGSSFGPWGALIGAGVGTIAAGIEEGIKIGQAANASGKVQELLKTDEGLTQIKTLLQYQYESTIDTTTELGRAQEEAVKSAFAGIVDSLDSDQMQAMLKKYNYNTREFTKMLTSTLEGVSNSLYLLSESGTSYEDQIAAAKTVLDAAIASGNEAVIEVIRERYGYLLDMETVLGEATIKYMDAIGANADQVSNLASKLKDSVGAENTQAELEEFFRVLSDPTHSTQDLINVTKDWGEAAVAAAAETARSGKTMQGVAEEMTTVTSRVQGIRETQANWGNMSTAERQSWISDNMDFFINPETGEWDDQIYQDFLDGKDTSGYIAAYLESQKEEMRIAAQKLVEAADLEISGIQSNINEIEAQMAGLDKDSEEYKVLAKELEDYKKKLAAANAERATGLALEEEAARLGELTLAQIVDKQNEQLEKLKEMYQAEEDALVDSLNKRKEAYQKYFDDLAEAETVEDYATSRDQLIENISKLSAGSDAASRNKVRELQKQLATLEKEEMQRQKEEARQAVLDNIDSQVEQIQEKFQALLDNNKALLATMDYSTKLQYLQYLQTLGLTQEDYEQRVQALGDTLDGIWNEKGLQSYGSAAVNTGDVDVNVPPPSQTTIDHQETASATFNIAGQSQDVTLSMTQMQDLVNNLFSWLNSHAGTSFKTI